MENVGFGQISKILPHRYPFLFVDRILGVTNGPKADDRIGRTAKTLKNVTFNENIFEGHFPNMPIMPGVLLVEAMAQTGGIACFQTGDFPMRMMIARIANARFRKPVTPGDSVIMEATVIKAKGPMVVISATAKVDDELVAECEFTAHVTNSDGSPLEN